MLLASKIFITYYLFPIRICCRLLGINTEQHYYRSWNHIPLTNQLMTQPGRSKHCCPPSHTSHPNWRHWTYPLQSMTGLHHQHLRDSTTSQPLPNSHTTPTRPHPSCSWKIRSTQPPPVTPSCNRRASPLSTLLHSSTIVVARIFLLIQTHPLFSNSLTLCLCL